MRCAQPGSRDDVWDQPVLKHRDLVAQSQFTLLQARNLELVRRIAARQGLDCRIQISMLYPEQLQATQNLGIFHSLTHPREAGT
jgi:hypothetical protein